MAKVKKHQSRTGSFAWRRWQPNLFGRFCKDNEGAAAVEFALIAFPFFLMMGGIFEFTFHFYVNRLLDNAVEDVSRKIRTKQITAANFNKRRSNRKCVTCPI